MKTVGIIAEYNPFHNGHEYQIHQALRSCNADHCIVVMSGNFVQRGTPAIMPKELRTNIALEAGASLVIELPVIYATATAEEFASGAVRLLNSLGCVDYLCFGSECGDLDTLKAISDFLVHEPEEYRNVLKSALKEGISFPKARKQALLSILHTGNAENITKYESVLNEPNNILGIEYLKALTRCNSKIQPVTILRADNGYHSTDTASTYASATAIRKNIDQLDHIQPFLPRFAHNVLKENYHVSYPIEADDLSLLLKAALLKETSASLTSYADVSEELANRIIRMRNEYIDFIQFSNLLKTKELTLSRIRRALLHIVLGIKTNGVPKDSSNYIRVLGFRKASSNLLSTIKQSSAISIITSVSKTDSLSENDQKLLELDIYASNLYHSIITDKFKTSFINELSRPVIIK